MYEERCQSRISPRDMAEEPPGYRPRYAFWPTPPWLPLPPVGERSVGLDVIYCDGVGQLFQREKRAGPEPRVAGPVGSFVLLLSHGASASTDSGDLHDGRAKPEHVEVALCGSPLAGPVLCAAIGTASKKVS